MFIGFYKKNPKKSLTGASWRTERYTEVGGDINHQEHSQYVFQNKGDLVDLV